MIHIDHNSNQNLILPSDHKVLDWDDDHHVLQDFVSDENSPTDIHNIIPSDSIPNLTPIDATIPSSSPKPAPAPQLSDPQSASAPTDPLDALSAQEHRLDSVSRQSTPLSDPPSTPDAAEHTGPDSTERHVEPGLGKSEHKDAEIKKEETPAKSPVPRAHSLESIPTPNSSAFSPLTPSHTGDAKVAAVLELNGELLKVCIEFQSKGVPPSDPRFNQYNTRINSNITYLAHSAEPGRAGPSQLPIMDPPISIDFFPMQRIQQLYSELPNLFAKSIARRQLTHSTSLSGPHNSTMAGLKRDRPDDSSLLDLTSKRRDTGETKLSPSALMPPPSSASPQIPSSFPTTNGAPPTPSQSPLSLENSILSDPQMAARRQAQMRAAQQQQQQQQMSPLSGQLGVNSMQSPMMPPGGNPGLPNNQPGMGLMQAQTMPGGPTQGNNNTQEVQRMMAILQNPNHQFTQLMRNNVPGWNTMPPQQQLQKMFQFQRQQQAQQMQRDSSQMMGQRPNPMGMMQSNQMQSNGPQFPGQNPVSPVGQMNQPPQNMMSMGNPQQGGMDSRQRQFMLMQQQQARAGGGGMAPNQMMMNPQQMMFMQQQRQGQGSPSSGGTMPTDSFPALRSNPSMAGIARSVRSPADNAPSPIAPRRGPSMGPDDLGRMMMQSPQQQMGQSMGGQGQPGFGGPQQGSNWPQQQGQPSMSMQPNQYGMHQQRPGSSRQSSGGGSYPGAVPSPPGQNWSQPGPYPFSPSPSHQSDLAQTPRHMSGTPQPMPMHNAGSPSDQMSGGDFDLFNWGPQ